MLVVADVIRVMGLGSSLCISSCIFLSHRMAYNKVERVQRRDEMVSCAKEIGTGTAFSIWPTKSFSSPSICFRSSSLSEGIGGPFFFFFFSLSFSSDVGGSCKGRDMCILETCENWTFLYYFVFYFNFILVQMDSGIITV